MGKYGALIFIIIFASSSLTMVEFAFAQSTPKLSVPEFTVAYADHSYAVSASTTIDPYTGNPVQNPAHHVENRTLQFTIKNIVYTKDGKLYYVIRMKGHFSTDWTGIYKGIATSDSAVTDWLFTSSEWGEEGRLYRGGDSFDFPYEGQVDFQIQAQAWGEVMAGASATNPWGGSITTLFSESDWSSTQTLPIPAFGSSSSSSTSQTSNFLGIDIPPTWQFAVVLAVIVGIIVGVAGLLVYFKKRKRQQTSAYEQRA